MQVQTTSFVNGMDVDSAYKSTMITWWLLGCALPRHLLSFLPEAAGPGIPTTGSRRQAFVVQEPLPKHGASTGHETKRVNRDK